MARNSFSRSSVFHSSEVSRRNALVIPEIWVIYNIVLKNIFPVVGVIDDRVSRGQAMVAMNLRSTVLALLGFGFRGSPHTVETGLNGPEENVGILSV